MTVSNSKDTNQASEDELTYGVDLGIPGGDFTALSIKKGSTLFTFVGDEAVAIIDVIRTEKLKLLAAVRERVVGEKTSPNFDNEYGYCINCEFQPTDGTKHCLCYYDEKLRKKQRTALNKLEAEL